jgi:hypothetical protein
MGNLKGKDGEVADSKEQYEITGFFVPYKGSWGELYNDMKNN